VLGQLSELTSLRLRDWTEGYVGLRAGVRGLAAVTGLRSLTVTLSGVCVSGGGGLVGTPEIEQHLQYRYQDAVCIRTYADVTGKAHDA